LIFNDKLEKMELVPIIYNSLILVFTILALVIGGSLLCSKLLFCGNNEHKKGSTKPNNAKLNKVPRKIQSVQREITQKAEAEHRKSLPKIEKKLIDNKKVKVVNRSESRRKENAQRVAANNVSRYSVVNTTAEEQRPRRDLYSKYSKMSIEYSQSA
jgi:predicted phage gp36 major capsid-like protein